MKPIARALAACALLLAVPAPAAPLPPRQAAPRAAAVNQQTALTHRMVRELNSSQYRERADNPTLAEQRQGHNALLLKQRGTGGCSGGWRDAVHESAWFGKLAKCWRFVSAERIEICPIAAGAVGKQSCFELSKVVFAARTPDWDR